MRLIHNFYFSILSHAVCWFSFITFEKDTESSKVFFLYFIVNNRVFWNSKIKASRLNLCLQLSLLLTKISTLLLQMIWSIFLKCVVLLPYFMFFSRLSSVSAFQSLAVFSIKDDAALIQSCVQSFHTSHLHFIQFQFCEVLGFLTGAWKYFWIFCWGFKLYPHFSLRDQIFRMNFHLPSPPPPLPNT